MKRVLGLFVIGICLGCGNTEPELITEKDGVKVYYMLHKGKSVYFTTKGDVSWTTSGKNPTRLQTVDGTDK